MHWLSLANSLGEAMGGGKEEGGAWLLIARGIAQGGWVLYRRMGPARELLLGWRWWAWSPGFGA